MSASGAQVDIAIVGGGPAGLATALSLIQADPSWRDRLLVLEKEVHPRHKLCAGGLTPFALRQLKRLELQVTIPYVAVNRIHFEYGGRRVEVHGQPAIAVTRRSEFDHWLAQQAVARGVRLRQNSPVLAIERQPEGIELRTEQGPIQTRVLVGADGSRGVVRRWLGARERPPHVARLLETVTEASGREPEYVQNFARFDFTPTRQHLQGYYWDFPSLIGGQPYMNRGVYDGRVASHRRRAPLPATLDRLAAKNGADPDYQFEGHPIHWYAPGNQVSAERVLLVGDAAGAEPLFGEGIGVALGHSQVATDALLTAFERQSFHFGGYRSRLLRSPVGRYLLIRWAIARLSYHLSGHPTFMRFVWRAGRLLAHLAGPFAPVRGVLV